jgi:hypothetical protein
MQSGGKPLLRVISLRSGFLPHQVHSGGSKQQAQDNRRAHEEGGGYRPLCLRSGRGVAAPLIHLVCLGLYLFYDGCLALSMVKTTKHSHP